jgi:hypothetical protein
VHWSLGVAALYEEALKRGEGVLSIDGPIVCNTAPHTGRSPNDKFIVAEASSEQNVAWGKVNRAIDEASFNGVFARMQAYAAGQGTVRSRTVTPALTPPIACRFASSPNARGTACSRVTSLLPSRMPASAPSTNRSSR